jgi:kinesin family member C2/C3
MALTEDILHKTIFAVFILFHFIYINIKFFNFWFISLTIYTLEIRNNSQLNGLNVPDACLVPVSCTQDVLDLMKIGQRNRAVGATALNERSSRSHR